MIKDHPVTGTGAGTFSFLAPQYQGNAYEQYGRKTALLPCQEEPFYVHNEYVHFTTELGIPGLIVVAAFLATCVKAIVTVWRTGVTDRMGVALISGGTGSVVGAAVFSMMLRKL